MTAASDESGKATPDGISQRVGSPIQADDELRGRVRAMLEAHWVPEGYAAPNANVYPWQWLWDSCFHALIWTELGDDRGTTELAAMFGPQDAAGFVPHMNYARDPQASADLWARRGSSSITQPPMYGHAIAEMTRRGVEVPPLTIENAQQGLRFLVAERARSKSGLVELCHPWESGADDSPRWDDLCGGEWSKQQWRGRKMYFVPMIHTNEIGSPIHNPEFSVASIGFNALIAFNIAELETVTGVSDLGQRGAEIAEAVASRWDSELSTWIDEGMNENGSGKVHTADAFFAALVDPDPVRAKRVADMLVDESAYGGACGPAGVSKAEAAYDPDTYWRGPAWPQLSYLLWLAMRHHGLTDVADQIVDSTHRGSVNSGLAEYWHPDSGKGLGAIPQSWAGLTLLMSSSNQ